MHVKELKTKQSCLITTSSNQLLRLTKNRDKRAGQSTDSETSAANTGFYILTAAEVGGELSSAEGSHWRLIFMPVSVILRMLSVIWRIRP
jgi:hypothetical protein